MKSANYSSFVMRMIMMLVSCLVLLICMPEYAIAEEPVAYIFVKKDGEEEASWYEGDPVIGTGDEVTTGEMIKTSQTIYYICAEPTAELSAFLESLSSANLISFFECGEGVLTVGTQVNPIQVNRIQVVSEGVTVVVYASQVGSCSSERGTIVIHGDVEMLELGTTGLLYGAVPVQNTTVYGDVDELIWNYSNTTGNGAQDSYRGDCTVTGTVARGQIREKASLEGFGDIYPVTREFTNVSGNIIENGQLNESISTTGIDMETATIRYNYQCYGFDYWQEGYEKNEWYVQAYADTLYLGVKFLPDFDVNTLSVNANVDIHGTCKPVVLDKPIKSLVISAGDVTVNADVEELQVIWNYSDYSKYKKDIDLTINGSVESMFMYGWCRDVSMNIRDEIIHGMWNDNFTTRFFSKDADASQVMENGQMLLMTYDAMGDAALGAKLPGPETLENALGITPDSNVVDDETGETIITKTAVLNIIQDTEVSEQEKEEILENQNVEAVKWIDIGVTSYYRDSNGVIRNSDQYKMVQESQLTSPVTIVIELTEEERDSTKIYSVLREHNGEVVELEDLDTNPNTVTFATDRFSTYAIVKQGEVDLVRDFVERFYTTILNRTSDPSGLAYWTDELKNGNKTAAEVAANFVFSDELEEECLSVNEFLNRMYRTFFDREADQGGMNHWTSYLEKGATRKWVTSNFVNSSEFEKICADYGMQRGTITLTDYADQNVDLTIYVSRCYQEILQRDAEPDGLEWWCEQIYTGQREATHVAKSFVESEEFIEKNLSDEDYVEVLYRAFMGRGSDEGGKSYWVGRLESGTSRSEALDSFAACEEFQEILRGFGL